MEGKMVGFIGIGVMGGPMCKNLIGAGYTLHVYDQNEEKIQGMESEGAVAHPSAASLASTVPITVTCLPKDTDVEEVVLGPEGLLDGAVSGSILLDTTTGTPEAIRGIAESCGKKGVEVLDAPISGGARGAQEGSLTFMAGGDSDTLEKCLPLLNVMGKTIFHVGPVGAGKAMKLINQVMLGINTWGMCEGVVLAKKAGVDLGKMLEVVSKSSGQSFTMDYRTPHFIMKGDFNPGFKTSLMIKDLDLSLEMGRSLGVPMMLTGMVTQAFRASANAGNADLESSAVAKWLGELTGVSFP